LRHDPDAPVLVLSPHLDDAVLSAWMLLRSDGPVTVATAFAGVPAEGTTGAFDPIFGTTDSAALVHGRRAEDREALAAAGRTPLHLDLLDAQYRDDPERPARLVADVVAPRVVAALREVVRSAASIAVPAGIGGHVDHLAVRTAGAALALSAGIPLTLYADLPYATNMGWPSWMTGEAADPHLVPDAAWTSALDGFRRLSTAGAFQDLTALVHRLDDAEMARKLGALRAYRSQFAALEGGPHQRISNPAILGFELHWQAS
jgi:LmbE family N-acetylglucosaminyl deacetylase